MNRKYIVSILREAILENADIAVKIFGNIKIPEQIDDTILALSSIDYVDLLIDVEKRLGFEIVEEIMVSSKISINELAERIEKYAQYNAHFQDK